VTYTEPLILRVSYHRGVKTTIELPDALLAEAKKHAAERGVPLNNVIEDGLRRLLSDDRNRKPFKLRKCSVAGSGLVPGMKWPRIRDEIYRSPGT
jgi:hypothetical protein